MEKISIIVPVYNGENTIEKCLESIVSQTVAIYEIIVVNDGSTDNTGAVVSAFSTSHPEVNLISTPNCGVSSARNTGLETAAGDYIGFVDGDDFIDNDMYETMLESIKSTGTDCCICGHYTEKDNVTTPVTFGSDKVVSGKDILVSLFESDAVGGSACTRLFKKSILENCLFDTDISMCEDKLFQLKLFSDAGVTISIINKPLYHYVSNSSSATSSYNFIVNGQFSYAPAFNRMERLIDCHPCLDATAKETIIKALLNNYRNILEFSMYTLLVSPYSDRRQIHELSKVMKSLRSTFFVRTGLTTAEKRHYLLLSYLPKLYKKIRL